MKRGLMLCLGLFCMPLFCADRALPLAFQLPPLALEQELLAHGIRATWAVKPEPPPHIQALKKDLRAIGATFRPWQPSAIGPGTYVFGSQGLYCIQSRTSPRHEDHQSFKQKMIVVDAIISLVVPQ